MATTLVCWHSERAGIEVLENAISALRNRRVQIEEVIYLIQASHPQEIPETVNEASVNQVALTIDDPTQHASIYKVVRDNLLPLLKSKGELHINISPGTPAMHSVWIILHAGGALPKGTRLWSSQFNPATKRTRIDSVDFPITTYMAEIRKNTGLKPSVAFYEPEANSPARKLALERLSRFSRVNGAPLLILGERGTGKTRIVETHVANLKQKSKVISVPCGGLDSALADSLLFGHRKGAFTGAAEDRPGLLMESNGGILFLDEVQDLPKPAQRKLVRVFQDSRRLFRPIGSDREFSVEVDLVCASNLSVDTLRNRLDMDFFDRISHLTVTIPPLRSCQDDLLNDWQNVWHELRRSDYIPHKAPWSPILEKSLLSHPLPGNLRDLQRLSELIMAWIIDSDVNMSIDQALKAWLEFIPVTSAVGEDYGNGSRNQRIDWFKSRMAMWAKSQFGTWKAAANALGCDEKTLREDVNTRVDQ